MMFGLLRRSYRILAEVQELPKNITSLYLPVKIRNFAIIAHVDHGKSTLADRLLCATGRLSETSQGARVLDRLDVERERGITVKSQAASMFWDPQLRAVPPPGAGYLLNLVDTPGHVDFSAEVTRTMHSVQGVLLLVDAAQGIEAQTIAHYYAAASVSSGSAVAVLPVLTKVDAAPRHLLEDTLNSVCTVFGFEKEEVLLTSAATGEGIPALLDALVLRVPPPSSSQADSCGVDAAALPLRARVLDAWADSVNVGGVMGRQNSRGTAALISVVDGVCKTADVLALIDTAHSSEEVPMSVLEMKADKAATEGSQPMTDSASHASRVWLTGPQTVSGISLMSPDFCPVDALYPGQVGVVFLPELSNVSIVRPGRTLCAAQNIVESAESGKLFASPASSGLPATQRARALEAFHKDGHGLPVEPLLPSYRDAPPKMYATLYAGEGVPEGLLIKACKMVVVNDACVSLRQVESASLGRGVEVGVNGLLHLQVFMSRLAAEHGLDDLFVCPPKVAFRITDTRKPSEPTHWLCSHHGEWLQVQQGISHHEPTATVTIICPAGSWQQVLEVLNDCRAECTSVDEVGERKVGEFDVPLTEVVWNLATRVQAATRGTASLDIGGGSWRPTTVHSIQVYVHGTPTDALACFYPGTFQHAQAYAKRILKALHEELNSSQDCDITLTCTVDGKPAGKEIIRKARKSVVSRKIASCGDPSRARKLMEKAKAESKAAATRKIGSVKVSAEAFRSVLLAMME